MDRGSVDTQIHLVLSPRPQLSQNMARTTQLSKEQRQSIITLRFEGQSIRNIARTLKVSPSAVMKTINRCNETGSYEDRPRKGRPRITSAAEDKLIRVTSLKNRKLTAPQITCLINDAQISSSISTSTVKRRLRETGLLDRIPAKKPLLLRTTNRQRPDPTSCPKDLSLLPVQTQSHAPTSCRKKDPPLLPVQTQSHTSTSCKNKDPPPLPVQTQSHTPTSYKNKDPPPLPVETQSHTPTSYKNKDPPLLPVQTQSHTPTSCSDEDLPSLPVQSKSHTPTSCKNKDLPLLPVQTQSHTPTSCSDEDLPSLPVQPQSHTPSSCKNKDPPLLPVQTHSHTPTSCSDEDLPSLPVQPQSQTPTSCKNKDPPLLLVQTQSHTPTSCSDEDLPSLPVQSQSHSPTSCSLSPCMSDGDELDLTVAGAPQGTQKGDTSWHLGVFRDFGFPVSIKPRKRSRKH